MITIHITADDIAHGIVRSSRFCPVARAVERAVLERCPQFPCDVFVYAFEVSICNIEQHAIYDRFRLPLAIQHFVRIFDFSGALGVHLQQRRLAPQSFELPGLEEAIVKIYRYHDANLLPPAIPVEDEKPVLV